MTAASRLSARGGLVRGCAIPVPDHAGLAEGEAGEHADDVEVDQLVHVGVEADDQCDREPAEQDDPVAEHELVAAVVHLPGQVAVLGRIEDSTGKPLNAVFAARIRMPAVAAWYR